MLSLVEWPFDWLLVRVSSQFVGVFIISTADCSFVLYVPHQSSARNKNVFESELCSHKINELQMHLKIERCLKLRLIRSLTRSLERIFNSYALYCRSFVYSDSI